MDCNCKNGCETLNITEGSDKTLLVRLMTGYDGEDGSEPFPIELASEVAVNMVSQRGMRTAVDFRVGDEGKVVVELKGKDFKAGVYGLEFTCALNGSRHRAYGDGIIRYTFATVRGAEGVTVDADPYDLTLYIGPVSDIIPRRTSELANDGDGESPFVTGAEVEEALEGYAPKAGTMPLTRMTDTLLDPDECLEPGIYENVAFPAIEYDHLAEFDTQAAQWGDKFSNNGTLFVSEVHGEQSMRTVQQVIVRTGGEFRAMAPFNGNSSTVYNREKDVAEVAVRAILFNKYTIRHPAVWEPIEVDPETGEQSGEGYTPAWDEEVEGKNVGAWVPMATFAHLKETISAIKENFATEDYVDKNGGKIDVIKYNGTPLPIEDKAVDIPVPAPYDDTAVRGLISANGQAIVQETARAQEAERQLNTDINTQTGRISTAIGDLETAKANKIAEMDAAKQATEAATEAAITAKENADTATQNANIATQNTNAAIAQAETVNAELDTETNVVTITDKNGVQNTIDLTNETNAALNGSTVTITDKEGNEHSIDLLDATNERVYINVTTDKEGQSVEGLTINAYYNNAETPSAQVTTDADGKCYLDVPNNYRYRLVFPTIAGCDPITDVTHIAHASERIVDVEYKVTIPQPEVGEYLTLVVQKSVGRVHTKLQDVEVGIRYDNVTTNYTTDANGEISVVIPYNKNYEILMPVLAEQGLYLASGKYKYTLYSEQAKRSYVLTYDDYQSGAYVVTQNGDRYTLEEFEEAREQGLVQNGDAKVILIVTDELMNIVDPVSGERKSGVFGIDIDFVRTTNLNLSANKAMWATASVIFTSIPINGNSISSPYYFDGLTASALIIDEQVELNVNTPAANYCDTFTLTLGGVAHQGFLGSVGQWQSLQFLLDDVEEILASVRPENYYVAGTTLYTLSTWKNTEKWTSTQWGNTMAYSWQSFASSKLKGTAGAIVPFFAF